MARGFQYQGLAQVIAPASSQVTLAQVAVDQEEGTKRLQYQALAFTPQPSPFAAPSTGWLTQWEQPSRRRQLPADRLGDVVFTPAAFQSMGWLGPWEQPQRRNYRPLPENPAQGEPGRPQVTAAPSSGWMVAWEPAPTRRPPLRSDVGADVFFQPAFFQSMGWLEPWEQPYRRNLRRPPEDPAHALGQPQPFAAPSAGWLGSWEQPRQRRTLVTDQGAQVFFQPLAQINVGWLSAWEQPIVRATKLLRMPAGDVAIVPVVRPPSVGWYVALAEPYRRNLRPVPENPAHALTPEPPAPFAAPSHGWHQPLAEPYRRNLRPLPENPAQAFGRSQALLVAPVNATLLAEALDRRLTAGTPIRLRLAWSPARARTATFVPNQHMSQAATLDPPIDPGEQETVGFDYGPALAAGVTLLNQQPSVTVTVGAQSRTQDGAPQSRLASQVQALVVSKKTGAPQAQWNVLFGPPLPGVEYVLQCLAATSDGQTLSIWVRFPSDVPQ